MHARTYRHAFHSTQATARAKAFAAQPRRDAFRALRSSGTDGLTEGVGYALKGYSRSTRTGLTSSAVFASVARSAARRESADLSSSAAAAADLKEKQNNTNR